MDKNTSKHFIATSDPDTAELLKQSGFCMVTFDNATSRWMFVNEPGKMQFTDAPVTYTDVLTFT